MAVSEWGIGKPDFSSRTLPGKAEVDAASQTVWYYTLTGALSPGWTTLHYLYQVPASQQLIIGFLSMAFSQDAIYAADFTVDGVVRYPNQISFNGAWSLGEAGWVFNAEEWMGGQFYNPLDIPVAVTGVPSGYLYEVE